MKLSKINLGLLAIALTPSFSFAQNTSNTVNQWDGYISGAVGVTTYGDDYTSNTNGLGIKSTGPSGEARASVAYTDKSGFGAQLDNVYSDYVTYGNGTNNNNLRNSISNFDMAAHLFYRTNKYLVGVYGQRTTYSTQYSGNGTTGGYNNLDRAYFLGGEGQYYFERATIYGQAGYQTYGYTYTSTNGTDYNFSNSAPSGYTASLQGRYYVKDNWRLDALYGYGTTSRSTNEGFSGYNYQYSQKQISNLITLGTEYRLDNSPISFFGRYDYGTSSSNGSGSATTYPSFNSSMNLSSNTVLLGIKITFGTGTLIEQDRRGVTLNPVNSRINAPVYLRGGVS